KEETGPDPRRAYRVLALPVGAVLLALLVAVVAAGARGRAPAATAAPDGVEAIARLLFTDYLFPFELTSVLLLAAMVGVIRSWRRSPGTWRSRPCCSASAWSASSCAATRW